MKTALRLLALALGLACLGAFLYSADLDALGAALGELGWRGPLVLLPWLLVILSDTAGWYYAFRGAPGAGLPPLTILSIRWAGETVNNVVPSGHLGGEAVKVFLLGKRGVAPSIGTASIVVSKTLQSLAQILVLAAAAAASLSALRPDSPLRLAMAGVIASGLALLGLVAWLQRRGFFAGAIALLTALGLGARISAERRELLKAFDEKIRGFYREDRSSAALSAGFYTAGWVLGAVEIMVAAWLLGAEIGFVQALAVEAFVGVFKAMAFFVPGALGVQEGGILVLCRALGLSDELALSYAVLRRAREVVYVLIGGGLLFAEEGSLVRLRRRIAGAGAAPVEEGEGGGQKTQGGEQTAQ